MILNVMFKNNNNVLKLSVTLTPFPCDFFCPCIAYIKNEDCNVIVIDWSRISIRPYLWASRRVVMVAQYTSRMIDFLQKQGMNLSKVTIVGHSLGGHVAGLSAYYAKGTISYVVGKSNIFMLNHSYIVFESKI